MSFIFPQFKLPNVSFAVASIIAFHGFSPGKNAFSSQPTPLIIIPPLFTDQVFHANDQSTQPLLVFTFNYATG